MSFVIFIFFSIGIFSVLYWYIKFMDSDGEDGIFGMRGDTISSEEINDDGFSADVTMQDRH